MYELAIKNSSVFTFILVVYLGFLSIATVIPSLHYVKYALPFVAFIIVSISVSSVRQEVEEFSKPVKYFLKLYIGLVILTGIVLLMRKDLNQRYFEEAYFILSPIISLMIFAKYYRQEYLQYYVKILFWGMAFAYFMEIIPVLPKININFLESLRTSRMVTESTFSFYFGLFALYYLTTREYRYFFFALLLAILGFKRIVLFAILVNVPFYLLLCAVKKVDLRNSKVVPAVMVALNCLFVFLLMKFAFGDFDEMIEALSGISSNVLSMGRQELFPNILDVFKQKQFFGSGLGAVTRFLRSQHSVIDNMHSDVLKYYIEYGVIMFTVWIYFLYRMCTKSAGMFVLLLYVNIILLSDNVSIYFDFMFLFYIFAGITYINSELDRHPSNVGDMTVCQVQTSK